MSRLVVVSAAAALTCVLAVGAVGSTPALSRIVLRASQVGPGYRLHQRLDGHGVRGLVTLDMCGFIFRSEKLRTNRLQVNYLRTGSPLKVSNEVVTYRPRGARQALWEVRRAVAHCPRWPVPSGVQNVGPLTYRLKRITDRRLLPGYVAVVMRVAGTFAGKRREETDVAVYQRRGDVLSAIYTAGGSVVAQRRVGLHAAEQSVRNLRRL